jgi:hypothetical protein
VSFEPETEAGGLLVARFCCWRRMADYAVRACCRRRRRAPMVKPMPENPARAMEVGSFEMRSVEGVVRPSTSWTWRAAISLCAGGCDMLMGSSRNVQSVEGLSAGLAGPWIPVSIRRGFAFGNSRAWHL